MTAEKTPTRGAAPGALRITVLAGGPSAEREVSLESGGAIARALRSRGHDVALCDIGPRDLSALDRACDVVFSALHGEFGEDGQLQKELEARRLRFVGSGSSASRTAIDKVATKKVAIGLGILTAEYEVVSAGQPISLAAPFVIKPIDQGSSVGTIIVRSGDASAKSAAEVTSRFGRALVERFIDGAEITVGVLDGRPLPPIRIVPRQSFYDYHAKYQDDATEYRFETGISQPCLEQLSRDSARLFEALGCRHLSRVDWIVDAEERAWLLEINTLPGFTSHSLFPMAAKQAGMSFDDVCDHLVRRAMESQP